MDAIERIGITTKQLLEFMQIAAEVEVGMKDRLENEDRDTYHVNINGDELGLLIGYKGENLDALEAVLGMMININQPERVRILLDIGSWRQDRYAQIERIVEQAIARIENDLEEMTLPPMKPYERRKAHELITNKGYTSESTGTEPNRRITIKKK